MYVCACLIGNTAFMYEMLHSATSLTEKHLTAIRTAITQIVVLWTAVCDSACALRWDTSECKFFLDGLLNRWEKIN